MSIESKHSSSTRFIRNVLIATLAAVIHTGSTDQNRSFADGPAIAGAAQAEAGANGLAGASDAVTKFSGKLKGVQRGILMVTRDDGVDVMISPPDDLSSFQFNATAKAPFLQRGMFVRLTGTFNVNGMAVEPIKSVTIFQPVSTANMAGHSKQKFKPGVYSANRHAPKQPAVVGKYEVVGNLIGMNPAGLMVQAGKRRVQVPLAGDAKLSIQFNNLNLAQPGDKVSVSGFYQPPDDTKVKADRVTITTDRVYGEPNEPQKPTRRTRRSTRRDDAEKDVTKNGGVGDAASKEEAIGESAAAAEK